MWLVAPPPAGGTLGADVATSDELALDSKSMYAYAESGNPR